MKRSGHHAIINWVCSQDGSVCHRNNAYKGWENRELRGRKVRNYGEFPINLMVNFEDFDLTDWENYRFEEFPDIERSCEVCKILVVRDFRNWLASCVARKSMERAIDRDVYENLRVEHENERGDWKEPRLTLYRRQLEYAVSNPSDLTVVKLDEWSVSRKYRQLIADQLKLEFTDEGVEQVADFGYGSSFDNRVFDGNASQMDVNSRWKLRLNDEEFFSILNSNLALEELSGKVFNGLHLLENETAADRILIGYRAETEEDVGTILSAQEAIRNANPSMEICYDTTDVPKQIQAELDTEAISRGLVVRFVKDPALNDFKYVTGLLNTYGGRSTIDNILLRIKLRTGLNAVV